MPGFCTVLLWLAYLSITVGGQVFLGYQWDSLLLEAGLLAILMAPWNLRLGRATDQPWSFAVWLLRWLVFRLMFMSGVVKLASHDPAWWDFTALDFHYETQPLPAWTSWYVHQMPPWFHHLSVAFMFYAELAAPILIFGTRALRRVAFVSLVLLQLLIAATGNYGFFNLLSIVLCTAILDDRDWEWLRDDRRHRRPRLADPVDCETNLKATRSDAGRSTVEWSWGRLGSFLIGSTRQQIAGEALAGNRVTIPVAVAGRPA